MSWISSIANGIEKAFKFARPALQSIPPILLLCEVRTRPGLSAIALTAAIIKRLPEAGIDTGPNNDGSTNKINQFLHKLKKNINYYHFLKKTNSLTKYYFPKNILESLHL